MESQTKQQYYLLVGKIGVAGHGSTVGDGAERFFFCESQTASALHLF